MMLNKKKTLIAIVLVIAVILSCWGCSGEQEEAYRMIQVLEVSGAVTVERDGIGELDAYAGMRLQSGDVLSVAEESWLKLQMDEDKYALVEPNSKLRLEATGSSADSKTVIHLEAGAISSRLESELSENSVYEVNTPNSTMAVRGTVFRVEVTFSEDGTSVTGVAVYDGTVESRLIYPDGTVDGEDKAVMIIDGTGVQIWGNDITSDYVSTGTKMDLRELQLKTLQFLKESYGAGTELSVSEEDLDALIAALEENTEPTETEPEATEPETEPSEPETTVPETTQPETTEPKTEPTVPQATEPVTQPTEPETTEPETDPTEPETTEPETDPTEPETTEPETDPTEPETTEPETDPTEPETTEPEADTGSSDETTVTEYTVTFRYDGKVFATQTVEANATATAPLLQPTASGEWDFDFSTAITEDTTIEWLAS